MKTQINYLKAILASSVFALIIFSCAKEEIIPTAVTTPESPRALTFAEYPTPEALNPDGTVTTPKVAIRGFECSDKGQSLIVYNPDSPDLSYFDSRDFTVQWYINGLPAGNSIRLDCTCRGAYFVIVLHSATLRIVGHAFYTIEEECKINNDGTIG